MFYSNISSVYLDDQLTVGCYDSLPCKLINFCFNNVSENCYFGLLYWCALRMKSILFKDYCKYNSIIF
jgi:hypothetical protein